MPPSKLAWPSTPAAMIWNRRSMPAATSSQPIQQALAIFRVCLDEAIPPADARTVAPVAQSSR